MTIPDHRMSTITRPADWITPDDLDRALDEDYEAGPVALNDTSEGLFYQTWHLTYEVTDDLVVTPAITGPPVTVLNIPNLTQCSLCFDQNGHVTIAYTAAGAAYLYWYDTAAVNWVTTPLAFGVTTPTVCMDDKRTTQTHINDILLVYTIETAPDIYTLYHREQRDRFGFDDVPETEYEHASGVPPYLYKLGMHTGLRVQLGLSSSVI